MIPKVPIYQMRLFTVIVFLFWIPGLNAQSVIPIEKTPQHNITERYNQASAFFREGEYAEALNIAEQALQYSMASEARMEELDILELMGDIYHESGQSASGLPYYLRAAGMVESDNDIGRMISLYRKIAEAYRAEQVHSREQEYYEKLLDVLPEEPTKDRLETISKIGSAAYHGKNYEIAIATFRSLLPEYSHGSASWLNIGQDLVTVFESAGQFDSALHYCSLLLAEYEKMEEEEQVIRLTNNLGYYHTLLNNYNQAFSYYMNAIEKARNVPVAEEDLALMLSNAAVCFTNMGNEEKAVELFSEAIEIFGRNGLLKEKSRNENLLANVYYATGDLYNAGLFCRSAIKSAQNVPEPWFEARAYLTYSNILRDGNDPVNALNYYEKYLYIRDSIEFSRRMRIQTLDDRKNMLDQQERSLRLRLKEDEVSELAIQQLKLQNEKIEQERELLVQERNLDLLKQDSLRQSIIIKDQQYLVARKERENKLLEQEKQLSELKLSEEVAKQEALEQQKQVLEQKQRLDQLELEKQKSDKQTLVGTVIGVGVLMLLILASLISTHRKKQLLAEQKEVIEEKNRDLEQKNEEISAQRDEIEAQRNLVFDQKQAIEAYNDEIMKSIEYAKRLQAAALPVLTGLNDKVKDQFVFFRPRDVVSGDFYWFAEVERKLVVTVADCTGHGVPGAFMSMMGMSLLKELVQKEYITHPGVILRRMRKEIINAMGQKGITGEQRDGMDMALITFDPLESKIDYAGAYNSMYLVRDKVLPAPELETGKLEPDQENGTVFLYEIPADKMPIAHFDRMDKYRNHTIPVFEGDTIYLFTDGFADQFGGIKGKKFMYKPFKRLLLKNSQLPLENQHQILSEILEEWMGNISQVDDICVMGIRF
jgi:serine phosphatase RsbU (regulator of sigma subunit)